MKYQVETTLDVDLQELYNGMSVAYQSDFIRENIQDAKDDDLIDEMERRGYIVKIEKDYT